MKYFLCIMFRLIVNLCVGQQKFLASVITPLKLCKQIPQLKFVSFFELAAILDLIRTPRRLIDKWLCASQGSGLFPPKGMSQLG